MKNEILRALRETDGYVSGQELCNHFGVSRTAVWKAINQLKEIFPGVRFSSVSTGREARRAIADQDFDICVVNCPLSDENGIDLIEKIAAIFDIADIKTEIIAASIRNPTHVERAALAGADIATVPYKVLVQMTKHPLTDKGIEGFQRDYLATFGK